MHAQGTWRGLEVAIKRVIFQVLTCMGDEANRMKALREAAINSTLNHPNIVSTYTHDMQPLGGTQNVRLPVLSTGLACACVLTARELVWVQ